MCMCVSVCICKCAYVCLCMHASMCALTVDMDVTDGIIVIIVILMKVLQYYFDYMMDI